MALNLKSCKLACQLSCRGQFFFYRSLITTACRFQKSDDPKDVFEQLKKNPYFDKYCNKFEELQKTAPEQFKIKLEESKEVKNKKTQLPNEKPFPSLKTPPPTFEKMKKALSFTKTKKLDDIVKLDLIKDKSPAEIAQIWTEYHKTKTSICAVMPSERYKHIYDRSKEFPVFLFPIPRSQGFEFIVVAFQGHECHFTPLINYQAYKENSPPCMSIIYYVELQEDKGMVLMHGEFNGDLLTVIEAQCLANQIQLYYGGKDEKKLNLLQIFTYHPDSFRYMDLVREFQTININLT